jgi:hypothetical protein
VIRMYSYPAIPEPGQNLESAMRSIRALKQAVELLTGARGDNSLRAYTASEATAVRTIKLLAFTIGSLPPARDLPQHMVYVSDGAGGAPIVVSNGSEWKYADGTSV